MSKTIPKQHPPQKSTVTNTSQTTDAKKNCCFNFRYMKTACISQRGFNNHYKDNSHYQSVISSFLGIILPKISDMTTTELVSGGRFSEQFHFHRVERDKYDKVKSILEAYSFNHELIEQILDGENIYQFIANLAGHEVESRVICEYIDGIIYVLFFDTNHHIYFNKAKAGESYAFTYCPYETHNMCANAFNCFAKSFLDVDKINETYGYDYSRT